MSLLTHPTQPKTINTRWLLPSKGTYIANDVKYEQAKYILFLANILSAKPLKEAFQLLNIQNEKQRLVKHPSIRFGRTNNAIWFAPCDEDGRVTVGTTPLAAIFFKQDSIEH